MDNLIYRTPDGAPHIRKERPIIEKLLKLEQKYNVRLNQINGQRILQHADSSVPPPTDENCEVYATCPKDIFEDELYPLFKQVGEIYEFRLMLEFSGFNRGYCYTKYTNESDARKAIRMLNGFEINGEKIIVTMSHNNSKLIIRNLSFNLSFEDIIRELINITEGIKRVSVFEDLTKRYRYAIVTYQTHRDAALARRVLFSGKASLFGKKVSFDWVELGFRADNVIEEAAEIKEDGKIVFEQPVIIESKKTRTDNQFNKVLKPGHHREFDKKSRIREQKLAEMAKRKLQKSQIRKKNQQSQALDSDEFAANFNGLKTDSDSCRSSSISDPDSQPATPNFSLFEEFTFVRPAYKSPCQESYQYDGQSEDDFCSNFENCLCFKKKKYDEGGAQSYQHEYAQAYGHNLQYDLNQHQSTSNYYQHLNGNNVFQFSQAQEDHQPPTASLAPKLNGYPGLEKHSPTCYNPCSQIYAPSYFKPLNINCQDYNQTPYIGKTLDMSKSKSYQKKETCSFKHIPSVRSEGYPSRRSQAMSSSNWTGRIIENESGQIPPGARPILRSRD